MIRSTRCMAPACKVITTYCLNVYLPAISRHCPNYISTSASQLFKSFIETCQKSTFMDKLECRSTNELSGMGFISNTEDICYGMQKIQVCDKLAENISSIDLNVKKDFKEVMKKRRPIDKTKYKKLRVWNKENISTKSRKSIVLRLISFNILAQELLETHKYLYHKHNKDTLLWNKRKLLIVEEILETESHIICLQEVQEEHLEDLLVPLKDKGYAYLYKKRTNDKRDGLLLLYKENLFELIEFSKLELFQNIEPLNRDNVGIIAKFLVKENPDLKFVIATTHLLYNPRRNDVKLGQVQLILAEIERISFIENTSIGPRYLPVVMSGDFNFEPYSGVYNFITEGSIKFEGKSRNLDKDHNYSRLKNSLIPPYLHVTDECQHFNVLAHRLSGEGSGKVMLKNTENKDSGNSNSSEIKGKSLFNMEIRTYQKIKIARGHYVTFSSGLLTHPFQFKSVYSHVNQDGEKEATTYQDKWITVDYVFYSNLKLIEKYTLPTADECLEYLPTIPNSVVGSDHLCIGATFEIKES